jgi:hypothetical protein
MGVYIIHAIGTPYYKIGAAMSVRKRLGNLQASCPHRLEAVFWDRELDYHVEADMLGMWTHLRAPGGGEWIQADEHFMDWSRGLTVGPDDGSALNLAALAQSSDVVSVALDMAILLARTQQVTTKKILVRRFGAGPQRSYIVETALAVLVSAGAIHQLGRRSYKWATGPWPSESSIRNMATAYASRCGGAQ